MEGTEEREGIEGKELERKAPGKDGRGGEVHLEIRPPTPKP